MSPVSFSPDSRVSLFGKNHTITQIFDNDELELRGDDFCVSRYKVDTLLVHYLAGNLRPASQPHPLSEIDPTPERRFSLAALNATEDQRAHVKLWAGLIAKMESEPFAEPGTTRFNEICAELGFKAPPSESSVRRKLKKLRAFGGDFAALMPMHQLCGGPGKSRMGADVQDIVDDVIRNVYLRTEKATQLDAYQEICARIRRANETRLPALQLAPPCMSAFRRHLKRLPAYQVYAARNGRSAANKRFRSSNKQYDTEGFMGIVEIDHTPLDVFVIDDVKGIPLGRPRLTIAIEVKTRSIIGFDLGIEGNSASATLHCIKHALLPKEEVDLSGNTVGNKWPCFGRFLAIRCDNGKEFHSADFQQAMFALGIEIIYAPARRPWFKGAVERVIGTVNRGFAHTLPGTTLSHFYKRTDDIDPSKLAVVTLSELRRLLVHWIVNIYMPTTHSTIKIAPLAAWQQQFQLAATAFPGSPEEIEIACCVTDDRKLQHYGVDLLSLRSFNNSAIQEIRRRHQHQKTVSVRVRYNERRLNRIWVEDPDEHDWIEVLNSDPETGDLTAFEVTAINRVVSDAKGNGVDLSIVEAKRQIREEVARLQASRKLRSTQRAHRLLGIVAPDQASSPVAMLPAPPKPRKEKATKSKPASPPQSQKAVDAPIPKFSSVTFTAKAQGENHA